MHHADDVAERERLELVVRDEQRGGAGGLEDARARPAPAARAGRRRGWRTARRAAAAAARGASARASATRCCWPPDSWCGARVARRARGPTRSSISCTRASALGARQVARKPKATLSRHGQVREQRVVLEHHADAARLGRHVHARWRRRTAPRRRSRCGRRPAAPARPRRAAARSCRSPTGRSARRSARPAAPATRVSTAARAAAVPGSGPPPARAARPMRPLIGCMILWRNEDRSHSRRLRGVARRCHACRADGARPAAGAAGARRARRPGSRFDAAALASAARTSGRPCCPTTRCSRCCSPPGVGVGVALLGGATAAAVSAVRLSGPPHLRVGAAAAAGDAGLRAGLCLHRRPAVQRPGADRAARGHSARQGALWPDVRSLPGAVLLFVLCALPLRLPAGARRAGRARACS